MSARTDIELPVVKAARRALGHPGSAAELAHRVLDVVGDSLGWLVGTMWVVDSATEVLHPLATWRARVFPAGRFEQSSMGLWLERGMGLPGRVWELRDPLWMQDVLQDGDFPRHQDAEAAGLHGALAFPVQARDRFVGVAEFFTDHLHAPVGSLIGAFRVIGDEVGEALIARDPLAGITLG